ncbi:hypothetical protein FQA39_LY15548 [Lamprigera yunnana]|nr:hypothetical protein FQA39_LY15548 [Lamprigera yunnana]
MMQLMSTPFSSSSDGTTHFINRRPSPPQTKWTAFRKFVWDKQKNTFCGRNCLDWVKIIIFYLLYLTCIFGFAVLLTYSSIRHIKGKYELEPCVSKNEIMNDVIPGLNFEPNILKTKSPLLWYGEGERDVHSTTYITQIEKLIKEYEEATDFNLYSNCSDARTNKPCAFYTESMGPCGKYPYGYLNDTPCIYLKLNKVNNWQPECYKTNDLLNQIPETLKKVIKNAQTNRMMWVHCEGMTPADVEHLGSISYYPFQGFESYYFPYKNDKNYLSPLVAVQMTNVKKGFAISISCSIWAKNIKGGNPSIRSTYIHLYIADSL